MQQWGYEPKQRRPRVDLNFIEIAKLLKVSLALMASNAQPVVHGLQWQLDIFRSFEFDNDEAPPSSDAEKIEHSPIARCYGRNLRIEAAGIELGIELGGIFEN